MFPRAATTAGNHRVENLSIYLAKLRSVCGLVYLDLTLYQVYSYVVCVQELFNTCCTLWISNHLFSSLLFLRFLWFFSLILWPLINLAALQLKLKAHKNCTAGTLNHLGNGIGKPGELPICMNIECIFCAVLELGSLWLRCDFINILKPVPVPVTNFITDSSCSLNL